jgi:hypothetical protein
MMPLPNIYWGEFHKTTIWELQATRLIFRCNIVYEFIYVFHLAQVISTVLRQNNHGGQHGICAKSESETKVLKMTRPETAVLSAT